MCNEEEENFYGEEGYVSSNIKGISDGVTSYTYTKLGYPCIVFKKDFQCPKHQMIVIRNMVKSKGENKDISLYFTKEGDLYKMGSISGTQVGTFLDIVGVGSVYGFYDKDTRLENSLLYTLCTL